MANTDAPRGLEPITSPQGAVQTTEYSVYASVASNIYIGDPAVRLAAGTVTIATAGANNAVLGSFERFFDADGVPVSYVPSTPGAGYTAHVADDPMQEFEIQEDGDTTDLALTDRGINVDLVAGSGSTSTGLSGWEIDSDTKGTSASKQLRLIAPRSDPSNAIGDWCRWRVRINYHQNLQGIVGAGV